MIEKTDIEKILVDSAGVAVDKGILNAEMLSEPLVNAWTELGVFQGHSGTVWHTGAGRVHDCLYRR